MYGSMMGGQLIYDGGGMGLCNGWDLLIYGYGVA